jgi:hypothetical protein
MHPCHLHQWTLCWESLFACSDPCSSCVEVILNSALGKGRLSHWGLRRSTAVKMMERHSSSF